MIHLMLDFETLGTRPDTAVLSLGAVIFNEKEILQTKYWEFDLANQLNSNQRSTTADTITWWLSQSKDAQKVFSPEKPTLLREFVTEFVDFLSPYPKLKVWGNGATFDVSIIEHILFQFKTIPPWKFWDHRCYRTEKTNFTQEFPFQGTKHNALDDAKYQANNLINHWSKNG